MKAVITGINGFVGKNLSRTLFRDNRFDEIVGVSRKAAVKTQFVDRSYCCNLGNPDPDSQDDEIFRLALNHHKPDIIFHLASKSTVRMDDKNPFKILQDNIISTQKVAHYAPKGCRVILASSVIVYGDWLFNPPPSGDPKYEESYKTDPTSIYGVTKRASEGIIKYYTDIGHIKGVSARMCATVGNGLTHGIVYDFMRKLQQNPTLEAIGSKPGSVKPFCYIDDLLKAFLILAFSDDIGEFNIVPDDEISVKKVASAVMEGLQIHKPLVWLGDGANWKGDNKIISVDNTKLKDIGWAPKYPKSYEAIKNAVQEMNR
jgi:UDP-glucose 4-epimerase